MENVGYVAVVPMTKEEKIAMYMKMTKAELAEMLYNSNADIDRLLADQRLKTMPESTLPKCKTWADCMNPFMDCLNCPVRGQQLTSNINYETTNLKIN
jgi:hypothetical protein